MTSLTPWLGTEPAEPPEIYLKDDDEPWLPPRRWWERFFVGRWVVNDVEIDRMCGPEYRMWSEQL